MAWTWTSPHNLSPYGWRVDHGDIHTLAVSMKVDGWQAPILITPDGRVLAGERRLETALRYRYDQVPTQTVTGLDELRAAVETYKHSAIDLVKPYTPREMLYRVGAIYDWDEPARTHRKALASIKAYATRKGAQPKARIVNYLHTTLAAIAGTSSGEISRCLVVWHALADPQRQQLAEEAIAKSVTVTGMYRLIQGQDTKGMTPLAPDKRTGPAVTATQVQHALSAAIGGFGVLASASSIKDLDPTSRRQLRQQLLLLRRLLATVHLNLKEKP